MDDSLDMFSLFATEDEILEDQAMAVAMGTSLDFKQDHIFTITNFDDQKIFQSIPLKAGNYTFIVTATKGTGTVPFLDLKVEMENPPQTAFKTSITLTIKNRQNESESITKTQIETFTRNFHVIYFSNFISLRALTEEKEKYFDENNNLNIYCTFSSSFEQQSSMFNFGTESRETTGYVGLQNQGATCYMNSMLQMLFHIPAFRQTVYDMPTADVVDQEKSIPLQLQCLFYNLQFSPTAVSTKDLTDSFGWRTQDIMVQHDVQEFNRVLMSTLERKLHGTPLENNLMSIFRGKNRSVIRCLNIDYVSKTDSTFTDLQLHVKDHKNLQESFEAYLEKDILEGSNQYNVDGHGKQDAEIGMELIEFPPVLQLHLNRFTYDFYKDCIVKINDYFEYPESIDLRPYLTNDNPNPEIDNEPLWYDLVGVLVHSGTNYAGHYYAYIKPEPESDWLEFNDSLVRKAKKEDVFQNNFGQKPYDEEEDEQETQPQKQFSNKGKKQRFNKANRKVNIKNKKFRNKRGVALRKRTVVDHSAYLLVYVRRDKEQEIYHPANASLPSHLHDYFKKLQQQKEEKAKQMLEKAYNADIQYITEDMLSLPNTVGFNVAKEDQKFHKVLLQNTIEQTYESFKELIEGDFSIWLCGAYGNPSRYLNPTSKTPIGQLISKSSILFILKTKEGQQITEDIIDNKILIFNKLFDPSLLSSDDNSNVKEEDLTKYLGYVFVPTSATISDIAKQILPSYDPNNLLAFNNIYGGKAQLIQNDTQILKALLFNGTLLTFQQKQEHPLNENEEKGFDRLFIKQIKEEEESQTIIPIYRLLKGEKYADVFDPRIYSNFMSMKFSAVNIECLPVNKDLKSAIIRLPLSSSYSNLKEALAIALSLDYDPSKDSILLFQTTVDTKEMKPIPIKTQRTPYIQSAFSSHDQQDICQFYYQLWNGISEEQMTQTLYQRIQISLDGISVIKEFIKLVKNEITVKDVFDLVLEENKDLLPNTDINMYRFFSVWGTAIWELLSQESKLNDDSVFLRIELIPEDHKHLEENEFLVRCSHAVEEDKEAAIFRPFIFKVSTNEQAKEIKQRIANLYKDKTDVKIDVEKWRIEVLFTVGGRDKRITLKNDDTLEEYKKQKSLELEILHNPSQQQTTRKHVPLKIFN